MSLIDIVCFHAVIHCHPLMCFFGCHGCIRVLKFSFQVYDEDKDNKISKVELSNAFSDVMDTRNITITKAQLAAVVNATFKQASTANADFITYEEYRSLIKSNPNSLQNFIAAYSVDIDAALQNAAAMHRAAKQKKKK